MHWVFIATDTTNHSLPILPPNCASEKGRRGLHPAELTSPRCVREFAFFCCTKYSQDCPRMTRRLGVPLRDVRGLCLRIDNRLFCMWGPLYVIVSDRYPANPRSIILRGEPGFSTPLIFRRSSLVEGRTAITTAALSCGVKGLLDASSGFCACQVRRRALLGWFKSEQLRVSR